MANAILQTQKFRLGMAAPLGAKWDAAIVQTGPVGAQRFFETGLTDNNDVQIEQALKEGRQPIVSTKVPNWGSAATGAYDSQLKARVAKLQVLGDKYGIPVLFTVHHEPTGDESANGGAANWGKMHDHLVGILRSTHVAYGAIFNGHPFKPVGGMTDAEIAGWITTATVKKLDWFGGDFYENTNNQPHMSLAGFKSWADRQGITIPLVLGELGCYTSDSMKRSIDWLLANHRRLAVACWFNSERNSRADWLLTGERLEVFKQALAAVRALPDPSVPSTPTLTCEDKLVVANKKIADSLRVLNGTDTSSTKVSKVKAILSA